MRLIEGSMLPRVYHYTDANQFLVDAFKSKQERNPRYSLRVLARQMGFKCHSSLLLLYQGKRKIRPEHVDRISAGLKVPDSEVPFLRALVGLQNSRTEGDRQHYLEQMKALYPATDFSLIEVERFRLVSDWVHMAILEMTQLADFQPDFDWIVRRLQFAPTREQVVVAVERLFRLGLMRSEGDRWLKTNVRLTTPKDFPSESIREHHRQVLMNGARALHEQSVDERVFNSCAMTIDASKLAQAKDLIAKFRTEMAKLMEKSPGDETYQLTVGFFKLTRKNPVEEK
jgi:uncharacterized protein (TIGR02147 family)